MNDRHGVFIGPKTAYWNRVNASRRVAAGTEGVCQKCSFTIRKGESILDAPATATESVTLHQKCFDTI